MACPRADCQMCGLNVKRKNLVLINGLDVCYRCKCRASKYAKGKPSSYAPIVPVARKIECIDFSQTPDADIQKLVESLRRPLRKNERQVLWGEYKRRGMGEQEAKERLESLSTGIARTKAIKKIKKKSEGKKKINFQEEFKKMRERSK